MGSAPKLDNGFFQNFIDGKVSPNTHPVLQVVESRQMASSSIYRLRMSDGNYVYSSCTIEVEITDRFERDGLQRGHGIIRVLRFSSDDKAGKKWLKIHDYSPIMSDYTSLIGNPQTYTGKIEDRAQSNTTENGHGEKRGAPPKNESPSYEPSPKRHSHPSAIHPPGQPVTPIDLLTPYVNKWRVCGVVSSKAGMREFNTAKGEFKVFSFILTDSKGASIRVSAFNEAATAFVDIITDGSTYYISGTGGIRASNKQYDPTPHSYEINLQKNSIIEPCHDVHVPTQPLKLHLVPLSKIPEHVGKIIDVIAIIRHADDVSQIITRRDQKELSKRDIYLVDQSGTEVVYTLWGESASGFDKNNVGKVVVVKAASVREFNGGYTLSTSQAYAGCGMIFDHLPQSAVRSLVAWYEQKKDSPADFKPLARVGGDGASANDVRLAGIAVQHQFSLNSERPLYMNITGMILSVKAENAIYQACGSEGCKKKVEQDGGYYRCGKCGWSGGECKYLFNLQVEVSDFSGVVWISVFDEQARTLINMDAKDVWQIKENSSMEAYNAIFGDLRFRSYEFRTSVRYETYNDQQRQKWGVFSIRPVPVERMLAAYKKVIDMEDLL